MNGNHINRILYSVVYVEDHLIHGVFLVGGVERGSTNIVLITSIALMSVTVMHKLRKRN
jgi:hypothetical protein